MATYQANKILNSAPARLVKVGITPVYEEIQPTTLAAADVFEMFYVPNGVRITNGFIKAVGGTGLDTGATLTLKVDIVDDAGTTNLLATTSTVRATGTEASLSSRGYLVVSAKNNAKIKITVVAAAAVLGTSKLGCHVSWSSYSDN